MAKVRLATDGTALFMCPGCDHAHGIRVRGEEHPVWGWNESFDAPTFTPSIRVTGVQPLSDEELDRVLKGEKIETIPLCCHSFVTDGKIQFLGDCTHKLVGQVVDIPEWE
jgi:hypothetical protein